MNPEDIIQRLRRHHLLCCVLRAVGLVCCFAVTAWLSCSLLYVFVRGVSLFWMSIAVAGALLVLGLLFGSKPQSYSQSPLNPDIDTSTASGFMARRQINRITALAYVFTQIVYSTANQLRNAMVHLGRWRLAGGIEAAELGDLISQLNFTPGQRRYRPASDISICPKLLARAVTLEIVLQQQEDGEILVGLNSDYN